LLNKLSSKPLGEREGGTVPSGTVKICHQMHNSSVRDNGIRVVLGVRPKLYVGESKDEM